MRELMQLILQRVITNILYNVHYDARQENMESKNLGGSQTYPSLVNYFLLRASIFSSANYKNNSAICRIFREGMQESKFTLYNISSL